MSNGLGKMECRIYYEAWEMECCGTPFRLGDVVEWKVSENTDIISPVDLGHIDYCYDAHSSEGTKLFTLKGKVDSIKLLYHKYELQGPESKIYVAVNGALVDADFVQGFDEDYEGLGCAGYVVSLSECSIS